MMKRPIALICVFTLMLLMLCGCSFSAVRKAEEAIDAIGTVSLDSAEAISNARALYDALGENKQEKVENYKLLENAEGTLCDLQIQNVESLIDEIGTEATVDQKTVEAARTAFDALDADMQSRVQNLDTLLKAEKKIEMLKHLSDYTISNYQRIGTRRVKVFNESATSWFSSEEKAATAFVCFLLQGNEEHTIDNDNISFINVYACINKAEDRIDIYSRNRDDSIMGIQYWPSENRAQVGTIKTELTTQEYVELLAAGGVVDSYKNIPLETCSSVLNTMYYAARS